MITIKINTSVNKSIKVELIKNKKVIDVLISDSKLSKSEAVVPLIDKLMKKNNLELKNVDAVEVFEGPGSFTGLRVGVSIANALGFLLQIPVNGKKIGELATPVYN